MSVYDLIAESWDKLRSKPEGFIVNFLKGKQGSVLFAGCGSGRHLILANSNGFNVFGFDLSLSMVKLADKKVNGRVIVSDVRFIAFSSKIVDYTVCSAVLHHLKPSDLVKALKELKRVSKREILISVWLHPKLRGEQLIKWGKHLRYYYLYNESEFIKIVKTVFKKVKRVSDDKNIILIVN